MKTLFRAMALAATASAAFAGEEARGGGFGLLSALFLGFAALILACQFVPALALFGSMLYGLFSSEPSRAPRRGAQRRGTA